MSAPDDGHVMRPGVLADRLTDEATEHVLLNDATAQREPVPIIYAGPMGFRVAVFPAGNTVYSIVAVARAVAESGVMFDGLDMDEVITITGVPTFEDAAILANAIRGALRGGGV